MQPVVGEEAGRTPPKRYILVDQDVGGAFSREFRSRNSVHVCATAESIREENNLGVSPRCNRERGEEVDAYRDTRTGRQVERDGPTHRPFGMFAWIVV